MSENKFVLSAIWGKSGRQNGRQAEILSATQKIPKPLKGLGIRNAGGGGRTHTLSPATDFESVSSANSNTPAYVGTLLVYQPHAKLSRHPRRDFADKFSDFFVKRQSRGKNCGCRPAQSLFFGPLFEQFFHALSHRFEAKRFGAYLFRSEPHHLCGVVGGGDDALVGNSAGEKGVCGVDVVV